LDPGFWEHLSRTEVWIDKVFFDNDANAREQLICMPRTGGLIGWREQSANQVVDYKLHVGIGRR